jgi:hypothetical protein
MRTSRTLPSACTRLAALALADSGLDRDAHAEAVRDLARHLHGEIARWVAARLAGRPLF